MGEAVTPVTIMGITEKLPKITIASSPYETHYYCKRCNLWIEKSAVIIRLGRKISFVACPICNHKLRTKPKGRSKPRGKSRPGPKAVTPVTPVTSTQAGGAEKADSRKKSIGNERKLIAVCFKIPDGLYNDLRELSRQSREPVSRLIRRSIAMLLSNELPIFMGVRKDAL